MTQLADTYVGFVDLAEEAEERLAYLSIYVIPSYRHMSIGSSMVRMVAPRLAELGLQRVVAETEADNQPARKCLLRAGFRLLSSEENAELLYTLDLSCFNHGSDSSR